MIILRCVVQKLCVAKNVIPPGLSIANLRYTFWYRKQQKKFFFFKLKKF